MIKMRLKMLIEPPKESLFIPWDYRTSLTQMIYKTLTLSDSEYSRWLHDEGFKKGKKVYKLFVYSDLELWHRRIKEDGFLAFAPFTWQLASPDPRFIKKFVRGIRKNRQKIVLFGEALSVLDMLITEPKSFPNAMTLNAISPVVISTYNPKVSKYPIYLKPTQPEFVLALEKNLFNKWEAFTGKAWSGKDFGLRVWKPKKKLIKVFDINVQAWYLKAQLWGSSELIRFAYDAGLGEKNSMGFGMLEAGG